MSRAPSALKSEIVRAARRAYAIGLQRGNGGNLSARVPGAEIALIKRSGVSLGECTAESLVGVSLSGRVIEDEGTPSRELLTHLAIYRLRPDVGGVFHCHSPWAVACAGSLGTVPLYTYHAQDKLGLVPVVTVEGHADAAMVQVIERLMGEHPHVRAFIQARHGVFAFGVSISAAEHIAELVEETAQIAVLLKGST